MPTITAADRTSPTSTVSPTHAPADAKRAAVVAKIEALRAPDGSQVPTPSQNAPIIAQDAPGKALSSDPTPTPQDSDKAPISQPNASGNDSTDARLAAMARKEKQVWAELKKVKAEKEALAKAQEGRMTREEWLKATPPEELANAYLNHANQDPRDQALRALQAEIQELKAGQKQVVSQAEQATKEAYNQALAQIDQEVKTLVSKTDAYEVTRSQGAEKAVTTLIELTYREEGVLMNVEEAAAQVEAYLEAEAITLFNKSPKLRTKLSPAPQGSSTQETQPKQQPNPQTQRNNTLTHAMSQASSKPLTRRDRAILVAQGKNPDTGR